MSGVGGISKKTGDDVVKGVEGTDRAGGAPGTNMCDALVRRRGGSESTSGGVMAALLVGVCSALRPSACSAPASGKGLRAVGVALPLLGVRSGENDGEAAERERLCVGVRAPLCGRLKV
jgi:hypothetical protein